MSTDRQAYRFADKVHWEVCVLSRVDPAVRMAGKGIRPIAPYDRPGRLIESSNSRAPVVTRAGEILWSNDRGTLFRLAPEEEEPDAYAAAGSLTRADRILAAPSGLWVIGPSRRTLECFDASTLARLRIIEAGDDCLVDLADPGDGSLLALVGRDDGWRCLRLAPSGSLLGTIPLQDLRAPTALVALRDPQRIVTLDGGPFQRLSWYSMQGGAPMHRAPVAGMRPCYKAHALGSDGRNRVLLAGSEGEAKGAPGRLVIHDADGDRCGDAPLGGEDLPCTGVAGGLEDVFVAGPRGLVRFSAAEANPVGAAEVRCTLATPALYSRDREDRRRWLRAEVEADLPEGTTLEIAWAATDVDAVRDRIQDALGCPSISSSQRIARLLGDPDLRRDSTIFRGGDPSAASALESFSARLFGVREQHLWLVVTLTAGGGARLPTLKELRVLYPGRTLMEDLPAIYQRQEDNPAGFLRTLVGVLETTTQGLDASIGSLSRLLNPATAPEKWLDYVARWLGVPWDDAFSIAQKRAVLARAAELLQERGTRRGLETLLGCLFPGPRPRFRVIDATADHGFAILGGGGRPGSRLPALLPSPRRAKLDGTASLGAARLAGSDDEDSRPSLGRIQVDVAATPREREAWSPWLPHVLREMTPLTAWLDLRWVGPDALRVDQLDGEMFLEAPRDPVLDSGAVVGRVRLPGGGTYLSNMGRLLGERLQLPGSDPHES